MPTQNRPTKPRQQVCPVSPNTVPPHERLRLAQVVTWIRSSEFGAPYAYVDERALVRLPMVLTSYGVPVAGGDPPQWVRQLGDYHFLLVAELCTYGAPLWHLIAEKGDTIIRDLWVPLQELQRAWRVISPSDAVIAVTTGAPLITIGEASQVEKAVACLREHWPPDGIPPHEVSDYAALKELKQLYGVSRTTGQSALANVRPKHPQK